MRYGSVLWLLLSAMGISHAGSMELTNGAIIPGTLERIDSGKVYWNAELIGRISVAEASIVQFESPVPANLQFRETDLAVDCSLKLRDSALSVRCPGTILPAAGWEEFSKAPPRREHSGRVTSRLTLERGNKQTEEIKLDGRISWRVDQWRQRVEFAGEYEEKRNVTTDRNALLDYQLDYLWRDGWYGYARGKWEYDEFSPIERILLAGIGVGREWRFGRHTQLLIQAGPDRGRFELQEQGRARETGGNVQWRVNHDARFRKLDLTLFHEGELAWVLRDSDLNRINTRTGLRVPLLLDGLIAEARLDYDRTAVNIPDIDDFDVEWVFSVGYRW